MQVDISTDLECSMDDAITHAVTTRLLNFVAYPLVQFTPLEPYIWPQTWAEGTYWVGVRIFGFVPFGKQAIVISYPASGAGFLLRDNGDSALLKVWDHTISISTINGRTRYRDTVTVHAGLLSVHAAGLVVRTGVLPAPPTAVAAACRARFSVLSLHKGCAPCATPATSCAGNLSPAQAGSSAC